MDFAVGAPVWGLIDRVVPLQRFGGTEESQFEFAYRCSLSWAGCFWLVASADFWFVGDPNSILWDLALRRVWIGFCFNLRLDLQVGRGPAPIDRIESRFLVRCESNLDSLGQLSDLGLISTMIGVDFSWAGSFFPNSEFPDSNS